MEPLAARLRPACWEEVIGQAHLKRAQHPLQRMIRNGKLKSLILYGPPGTGKTTLAKIIASTCALPFVEMNATMDGTKEIRAAVEAHQAPFVLFLDELHHLNKRFQNVLLPHLENGHVICIGTTTENPYRAINDAMRSRMFLVPLYAPVEEDVRPLLARVKQEYPGVEMSAEAGEFLLQSYAGDVRFFLAQLEMLYDTAEAGVISIEDAEEALGRKRGENPNQLMSALIKSMRGGDPDATLHYLGRLAAIGTPGAQIFRRLGIFAAEDVGLARPEVLQVIASAHQLYDRAGEDRDSLLILAEAALYLSMVPKSRSVTEAVGRVMGDIEKGNTHPVPPYLRTHYEGLQIAGQPDAPFLHPSLGRYYLPSEQGSEKRIREYLAHKGRRDHE